MKTAVVVFNAAALQEGDKFGCSWPQGSVGSCYWGRSKPERLAFNTQRKLWPPSVALFVCRY